METKQKYRLTNDCFVGKVNDIITIDQSFESDYWKNETQNTMGSPFGEWDYIVAITDNEAIELRLSKLWNRAVSEVGGLRNTLSNFQRIFDRFYSLGVMEGFRESQINEYAQDIFKATSSFMEVV